MTLRTMPVLLVVALVVVSAVAGGLVSNGPEPRDGLRTVDLEELWRAGGPEGEDFFGLVPRVAVGPGGRVHVLDAQQCQVSVFAADGELERTLFREGDGPGEIRGPRDMVVMGDGRVGLVSEELGKVVFVHADGTPAGGFRLSGPQGGIYNLCGGVGSGDHLVLSGTRIVPGEVREVRLRTQFLDLCTVDGEPVARLAEGQATQDFRDFRFDEREHMPSFWWAFTAGADGRLYAVTDRDRYAVSVFDATGTPLQMITRDYPPFPRTRADRDRYRTMIETSQAGLPLTCRITVADEHPAVADMQRGLQARADGTLWVLSSRGARPAEPGVMAVWDVFDRDGVFVRQVAMRAPHDGSRVALVLGEPDLVVVVKGHLESLAAQLGNWANFGADEGQWDVPEVICYRMVE